MTRFERLPLEKLAAQCGVVLAARDFPETVRSAFFLVDWWCWLG